MILFRSRCALKPARRENSEQDKEKGLAQLLYVRLLRGIQLETTRADGLPSLHSHRNGGRQRRLPRLQELGANGFILFEAGYRDLRALHKHR